MRTPDEEKRNAELAANPDCACYVFRGYVVLQFNKKAAKEGQRYGLLYFGPDANSCLFIPEDLALLAKFLNRCKDFCDGKIDDVETVLVG